MRGIRRTHGAAPRRATPATADRVIALTPRADGTLTDLRDRAILLLGFAGAFRRSELVALDVADVEVRPEGLRVTIRRGKTDQEGHGAVIAIIRGEVACPVAALQAWLQAAQINDGAISAPFGAAVMSKPSASQIDLSPTSSKHTPSASAWILPCSQAIHYGPAS